MKPYIFLGVFLMLILGIRFLWYFQHRHVYKAGDVFYKTYTFLSDPRIKYGQQIFSIDGVTIFAPSNPSFSYGDTVSIRGEVREKARNSKERNQVIKYFVIKNPHIDRINQSNLLIASASKVRKNVMSQFSTYLGSDESSLLLGIAFGIKAPMSARLSMGFKNTGVLHVIAASGENVSIISGFLLAFFGHIFSRRKSVILTLVALWYYALLAGLDPSIVRASLMGSLAFGALMIGRQYYGVIALYITAWCMLMWSPVQIQDAGFLLSFSATLGIITLYPLLQRIPVFKLPVLSDLSTTLAAQIVSLPVMMYFFSSYSVISIVVNALILWTVPILMVLGGAAAVLSLLPLVSSFFLYLANPVLIYFEGIVLYFSNVPVKFSLTEVSWSIITGYYLLIVAVIVHFRKFEKKVME